MIKGRVVDAGVTPMRMVMILVVLLMILGWCGAAEAGQGLYYFHHGEQYKYSLSQVEDGEEKTGSVTLAVREVGGGELDVAISGEFAGQEFSSNSRGQLDDPDGIFLGMMMNMFTDIPEEAASLLFLTVLNNWMGDVDLSTLEVGQVMAEEDDFGDVITMEVVGKASYAGQEGFLIQMANEYEDGSFLEMVLGPDLALPLKVEMKLEEGFEAGEDFDSLHLYSELVEYSQSEEVARTEPLPRELAEEHLDRFVDHLAANGLGIGAKSGKAFSMIGAVSGYGIEVEGEEIELYLFDLEAMDAETKNYYDEARDTGVFYVADMEMEMPVFINGAMMITGLEFGTFYVHPAKDDIVALFESF